MSQEVIIGPFSQILTMNNLPLAGAIQDSQLEIVNDGGIWIQGNQIKKILRAAEYNKLISNLPSDIQQYVIETPQILLPGFIDAHTHICFAGSRSNEYAMKLAGSSYQDIMQKGGGILSTVQKTRAASQETLVSLTRTRAREQLSRGVTTCEVKSGYGLTLIDELKMLRTIQELNQESNLPELIPTCLAAHVKPSEFDSAEAYLEYIITDILPRVKQEKLSSRVDIYIEKNTFPPEIAHSFLNRAKQLGFSIVIHADQFSIGGSVVAAHIHAVSADHLEVSSEHEFQELKANNVIPIVLPGASLGLGIPFAPARKILDAGLPLVIASDWNPGTAPMGNLLLQTCLLGIYQKLTIAEQLAGITCRAARALELSDRGILKPSLKADMIAFPCSDFTEICYHQGQMLPSLIWKNGLLQMIN